MDPAAVALRLTGPTLTYLLTGMDSRAASGAVVPDGWSAGSGQTAKTTVMETLSCWVPGVIGTAALDAAALSAPYTGNGWV